MSSDNCENNSSCIDCGADIARNGKEAGQRYICSVCGADYRDRKKTTLLRLTKKLNVWESNIQKIDKKVMVLQEKRKILEDNIDTVNDEITGFKHMLVMVDANNIKTRDDEDIKYMKNIVVKIRKQIKETLKLK